MYQSNILVQFFRELAAFNRTDWYSDIIASINFDNFQFTSQGNARSLSTNYLETTKISMCRTILEMPIKNLDLFHYILVFVIPFWFSSLLQPIQVLVSKILNSIYLWKLAILPHFNFQTPSSKVWSSFRRWILLLFQSLWFSVGI